MLASIIFFIPFVYTEADICKGSILESSVLYTVVLSAAMQNMGTSVSLMVCFADLSSLSDTLPCFSFYVRLYL